MNALPRCDCGTALEIAATAVNPSLYRCVCPRCWERAARGEGDGFIIAVHGYGYSPEQALAVYRERVEAA